MSQEAKIDKTFSFVNKIGFTQYEIENVSVSNALLYGISFTKDVLLIDNKLYLNTGIGLDNYFFDQKVNNIDLSSKSMFINVPLRIKYSKMYNKNSFFTSVGILNSYKINEKQNNILKEIEIKGEKGFNFSSNVNFGFCYFLSNKMSMVLGVDYLADFASLNYKNATKRNNQISLVIGFGF